MDAKKVRALISVIENKSLSAAAEKLGYTPSGISRMMATLESELGFQLLIRKKEGVSVTPECMQMLPAFRSFIKSEDECLQMAGKILGMEIGTITIGSAYSYYYRWLSECVKAFSQKYPGIHMELSSGYSSDLVNRVHNHTLDIAIVSRRETVDEWIPIGHDSLVAWLPANHPLSNLDSFPIEKLSSENYIDSNSEYITDNELVLAKYGITPNTQLQSKDSFASWQMVEAGLGIGLNNQLNSIGRTGQVKVLPLNPEQIVEIGITYSRDLTLASKLFMKHMKKEYLKNLSPIPNIGSTNIS